jgi:hypothetical protein
MDVKIKYKGIRMKTLEHEIRDVLSGKNEQELVEEINNRFVNMINELYEEPISEEQFLSLYESYIEYLIEQEPSAMSRLWSGVKGMGSKILGPLGIAYDANERYSKGQSIRDVVGGTASTLAGGIAGAKTGAALGALGGPAGVGVGGIIGGVLGGIGAGDLYDKYITNKPSETNTNKQQPTQNNKPLTPEQMGIKQNLGVNPPPKQNAPTPSMVNPTVDTKGSDAAEIRRATAMTTPPAAVPPMPKSAETPAQTKQQVQPPPPPAPTAMPKPQDETRKRMTRPTAQPSGGSFSQYPQWAQKAFAGN